MSYDTSSREPELSGGASAGITFGACLLIIIGTFQVIAGLAAVIDDEFYVLTENYAFDLDISAWGWIHLLLGVIMVVTGFGLFAGSAWAAVSAIVIASVSAIVQFFFIPYYPFWAILVIALDVWVIWALTRPGAIRT